MRKLSWTTLLLFIYGGTLVAQNRHLTFFNESNGLPSNEARDVIHDAHGFLWIASDGGLLRFDGHTFFDYSRQIPSRYPRSLITYGEDLLVSHDAGISRISPFPDTALINSFLDASVDPQQSGLYYPGMLFLRKNQELWIGQPGGRISVWKGEKLVEVTSGSHAPAHPEVEVFFTELDQGLFIVAYNTGGLYYYDDRLQHLTAIDSLPHLHDLKSSGNEIWIAGNDIHHLIFSKDEPRILHRETYSSGTDAISCLSLDSQANLFAGIQNQGLFYVDRREGRDPRFIQVFSSNDPHRVDELPFRNIHRILAESDDRLWICASEGMGILQRRFFESIGSIPNAHASAICVSDNGKIFVNFGDMYMIEKTDLGYEGKPMPSFSREPVTALTMAGGRLWAGTSTGNLIEIDQSGRTIREVDLRSRGEGIYYMNFDSRNRLWVCQAPEEVPIVGVGCITPDGTLKEYGVDRGLESRLLCLRETDNGRIYASGIGSTSFLYRYLPEEDLFMNLSMPLDFPYSPNFEVHDLAIDRDGVVWMASTNGLLRYDMDRVRRVNLGSDYTDIEIRAVSAMPDGSIWASTDTEGVLCYRNDETVVIKEESGLPSKVMTYRCLVSDPSGRLWVGTAEGVVFSLKPEPAPRFTQMPLLVSATVDGIRNITDRIILLEDQILSLRFVTPSFHGYRTFYQHRLNDTPWSEPSSQRELRLDQLEPGNYRIEVRARKEGGYIWSDPRQLDFEVILHWYSNPLYLWSLGVLLVGFIILIMWYRRKRYLANTARLTEGLRMEKDALEQRDADLHEVKKEAQLEHRQVRAHMLTLEIMHRLISKITPGMKWEETLEMISLILLKLPGVVAFEIGIREGNHIQFEGYSEWVRNFTSDRVPYDPAVSLAAYCMEKAQPTLINQLASEAIKLVPSWDRRLNRYGSAISVPFFLENRQAILSIYSDKEALFNDYALKAMTIFVTYLEQIS